MTITTAKSKKIGNSPAPAVAKGGPGELGMRNNSEFRTPHSELRQTPLVSSEVFSINFIRGEFLPPEVRRWFLAAGLGWLVINALVMVSLLLMMAGMHYQSRRLQAAVRQQITSAGTVDTASQEIGTLGDNAAEHLAKLNAVLALERQRFPSGSKLAAIARTLPARTWLTAVSGDRKARTLNIQAAYLINQDSPYDLPTKAWLAALREDPGFREGLTRLDVGTSSRKRVGEAELFSFELMAQWQ